MNIQISKSGLAMAASAFALCLAAASPSVASQLGGPGGGEGGGCEGQEGGCGGPHDPPPRPHTPAAIRSDGNSTIHAGSAYSVVHTGDNGAVSVNRSGDGGTVVMSTSLSPLASVTSHAIQTNPDYFSRGDLALTYSVIITAGSQGAADGLSAWLGAGHEIGSVHGTYDISYLGQGDAVATLHTGFNVPGATGHAFDAQCSTSTLDPCGTGAFNVSMDFVSAAATYSNGSPFDFYSSVFMAAGARAGASGLSNRVGEAQAYIDPFISLNFGGSGLNASNYTLTLGDGSVANASADGFTGGGVPEPATWGLMIVGFGLAGATLRRRRTVVA